MYWVLNTYIVIYINQIWFVCKMIRKVTFLHTLKFHQEALISVYTLLFEKDNDNLIHYKIFLRIMNLKIYHIVKQQYNVNTNK